MRTMWITMSILVAALMATAFIRAAEENAAAKKAPSAEDMMAMMAKLAATGPELSPPSPPCTMSP